jgi:hypothetical protein
MSIPDRRLAPIVLCVDEVQQIWAQMRDTLPDPAAVALLRTVLAHGALTAVTAGDPSLRQVVPAHSVARQGDRAVKHKFWTWVAIAFAVFFIVKNPAGAAATAAHIGAGLASAATSVGNFVTYLTGGGGR